MSRPPRRPLGRPTLRLARRPGIERLEGRQLLSTIFVTTINDGGTGSLRAAILTANDPASGVDRIGFNIPGTGVHTIAPASALPTIMRPITIDGTTQPGASPNTLAVGDDAVLTIVLDGVGASGVPNGLTVAAGGTTVRGLVISRFNGEAIDVSGPGGDVIAGNFFGTDSKGTTALGGGTNFATITMSGSNHTIGGLAAADRNIVAASGSYGILLTGGTGTRIVNNYIGTDRSGAAALGARFTALNIQGGSGVTVGGVTAAERNVISGNRAEGVLLQTSGNVIQGNYIGTDASGTLALTNGAGGVVVNSGGNTIGGTATGAGNLISGNGQAGLMLHFSEPTAPGNLVQGNLIGTDRSGTFPIPNVGAGVDIGNSGGGGYNNTIGGTTREARNIVSGNKNQGVFTPGAGSGNVIEGNYIGTDLTGQKGLPNGGEGVNVASDGLTIGGTAAGAGNIIAANKLSGIFTFNLGTVIQGNIIGLAADGVTRLGNGGTGITTFRDTRVGGTTASARNVISDNGGAGIAIKGGSGLAQVQGNSIGTDISGLIARGNVGPGVLIDNIAGNTIGGADAGAGNLIAANGTSDTADGSGVFPGGIEILGPGGSLVQGNRIGLASDGKSPLGNRGSGIVLAGGATNGVIRLNTIAYNGTNLAARAAGIAVTGASSSGNRIDANAIFSNTGLGIDLGNDGPTPNIPGGPHAGPNRLQNFPGITSVSTTSTDTVLVGKFSGTPSTAFNLQFFRSVTADASGFGEGQFFLGEVTDLTTDAQGFASFDVSLRSIVPGGQFVSVTATDPAGNTSEFSAAAVVPVVDPLVVTTTADGGVGSLRGAITYANGNPGHDVISFNISGAGVRTIVPLSPLPTVAADVVIDGTTQPGFSGTPIIELDGESAGFSNGLTLTGGGITVRGLVIDRFQFGGSGGTGNGILIGGYFLEAADPGGNLIEGNYIGIGPDGVTPLGNGAEGANITNSSNNVIGGVAPGTGNVIAANGRSGVLIQPFQAIQTPTGNVVQGNLIGTDAAGTARLGNLGQGIFVNSVTNTTIGGASAAAGNVVAASSGNGIQMMSKAGSNTLIENNFLGTDRTASLDLANSFSGIVIVGSDNSTSTGSAIGGATPGLGNVIAFNHGAAVDLQGGRGLPILGNSIFLNFGGISYRLQALSLVSPPTLTSVASVAGGTAFRGSFVGLPRETARIEFFASDRNDRGSEQGKVFLGFVTVTTDPAGNATFDAPLPIVLTGTRSITATATGLSDTTSRFSDAFSYTESPAPMPADLSVVGSISPLPAVVGAGMTYTFLVTNLGPNPASGVTLTDTLPSSLTIGQIAITQGTARREGNSITANLGGLAIGATATVTIAVTPMTAGNLSDTAVVGGNEPDPASANNTSTIRTSVSPAANPLDVTTTLDGGVGSLRAAITYANSNPGHDAITFAIPSSGIQAITPLAPLPDITDPVTIDGYSQPGARPNDLAEGDDAAVLIEIDGANAGAVDGLVIAAGGSTIRGLSINGFAGGAAIRLVGLGGDTIAGNFLGIDLGGDGKSFPGPVAKANSVGVRVETAGNTIGGVTPADRGVVSGNSFVEIYLIGPGATANTVEGNYVGTNPSGTATLSIPGGGDGVDIDFGASNNTVGGTSAGARNVLSGNGASGVRIAAAGSNNNLIEGNFIGTDASGSKAVGNAFHGVLLHRGVTGNTVGGTTPDARNVISGNLLHGVAIADAATSGNLVAGDFIGTDAVGSSDLGNGIEGVSIAADAFNNTVGGSVGGAGNTIAFNARNGVTVEVGNGSGNAILANAIFGNRLLGIDLGNDGPTANTPGGPHSGPDALQNGPIITSAQIGAGSVVIGGTLNSNANTTFRLEFFQADAVDSAGHGQGHLYLGSGLATTNDDGNASYSIRVGDLGGAFVATATDPTGNTSEFSLAYRPPVAAVADLSVTGIASPASTTVGLPVTYKFTVANAGPDSASGVTLTVTIPEGASLVSSSGGVLAAGGRSIVASLGTVAGGTTVSFSVTLALGSVGSFAASASVTAATGDPLATNNTAAAASIAALAAPTGLIASYDGKAIVLQWSPTPGASGYNIYRAVAAGSWILYGPAIAAASYRDLAVAAGTSYSYVVTAVVASLEGPPSNVATASVPAAPTAQGRVAPTSVVASYFTRPDGSYTPFITWGYPVGLSAATRFNVYRSTMPGSTGSVPYATNVLAHNFLDPSPAAGVVYYYQITAALNDAEGDRSATVRIALPGKATVAPLHPINLKPASLHSHRTHSAGTRSIHRPIESRRKGR